MPLEVSSQCYYSSATFGRRNTSSSGWKTSSPYGSSSVTDSLYIGNHGLESSGKYAPSPMSSMAMYLPPQSPVPSSKSSYRNVRPSTSYIHESRKPYLSPAMSKRNAIIGSLTRTSRDLGSEHFLSQDAVSLIAGSDNSSVFTSRSSNVYTKPHQSYSRSATADYGSTLSLVNSNRPYSTSTSHFSTPRIPLHNTSLSIVTERPSITSFTPRPRQERVRPPIRPIRRDRPILKFVGKDDLNPVQVHHLLKALVKGEKQDEVYNDGGNRNRDSVRSNDSGIGSVLSSRQSDRISGDLAIEGTGISGNESYVNTESDYTFETDAFPSCLDEGIHLETDDGFQTSSSSPECLEDKLKGDIEIKPRRRSDCADVSSSKDIPLSKRRVRINTESFVDPDNKNKFFKPSLKDEGSVKDDKEENVSKFKCDTPSNNLDSEISDFSSEVCKHSNDHCNEIRFRETENKDKSELIKSTCTVEKEDNVFLDKKSSMTFNRTQMASEDEKLSNNCEAKNVEKYCPEEKTQIKENTSENLRNSRKRDENLNTQTNANIAENTETLKSMASISESICQKDNFQNSLLISKMDIVSPQAIETSSTAIHKKNTMPLSVTSCEIIQNDSCIKDLQKASGTNISSTVCTKSELQVVAESKPIVSQESGVLNNNFVTSKSCGEEISIGVSISSKETPSKTEKASKPRLGIQKSSTVDFDIQKGCETLPKLEKSFTTDCNIIENKIKDSTTVKKTLHPKNKVKSEKKDKIENKSQQEAKLEAKAMPGEKNDVEVKCEKKVASDLKDSLPKEQNSQLKSDITNGDLKIVPSILEKSKELAENKTHSIEIPKSTVVTNENDKLLKSTSSSTVICEKSPSSVTSANSNLLKSTSSPSSKSEDTNLVIKLQVENVVESFSNISSDIESKCDNEIKVTTETFPDSIESKKKVQEICCNNTAKNSEAKMMICDVNENLLERKNIQNCSTFPSNNSELETRLQNETPIDHKMDGNDKETIKTKVAQKKCSEAKKTQVLENSEGRIESSLKAEKPKLKTIKKTQPTSELIISNSNSPKNELTDLQDILLPRTDKLILNKEQKTNDKINNHDEVKKTSNNLNTLNDHIEVKIAASETESKSKQKTDEPQYITSSTKETPKSDITPSLLEIGHEQLNKLEHSSNSPTALEEITKLNHASVKDEKPSEPLRENVVAVDTKDLKPIDKQVETDLQSQDENSSKKDKGTEADAFHSKKDTENINGEPPENQKTPENESQTTLPKKKTITKTKKTKITDGSPQKKKIKKEPTAVIPKKNDILPKPSSDVSDTPHDKCAVPENQCVKDTREPEHGKEFDFDNFREKETGFKDEPERSLDDLWLDYNKLAIEEPKTENKELYGSKLKIENFHFLKVLGRGSFGKVMLAELKDRNQYFAIKCLKKNIVQETNDVECAFIERDSLNIGLNHPYLCTLYGTFQNESHLFYVMEYLSGGDLMFHIQQTRRFGQDRARFYSAEIVCALKYLHQHGIIYRDVKMDNICIDSEGHIRLVDFGFCKLRIHRKECLPRNVCGTPDYMAPEMIKGHHYNQSVDWWSFGVLLYEILVGKSPFNGANEEELFRSICNEEVSYPRFISMNAKKILSLLLNKNPEKRLGMPNCDAGDIYQQPFFHCIDWDKVKQKKSEPPFKPKLKSETDVSNFDDDFTMEKATLTPINNEVLATVDQELFHGFTYTNLDMFV